ncbi:uncharacterized protein LOC107607258 [Arachis ipaensis]|uniref:uncharacterized protein LOC107607258 n=1 Tax=Arachis ipaensis TaxID=130454 RepID=UPI0007AF368F|nr:uncharacterized protein LOC107607258 [Arachis ipaensis]
MQKEEVQVAERSEQTETLEEAESIKVHPQKSQEQIEGEQFIQFLYNIPLAEVLEEVPPYRAVIKVLLSKKKVLKEDETMVLIKEAEYKEVYVTEELKKKKAEEKTGRTLLHASLVTQEPKVPHPQKTQKETKYEHYSQFMEVFKKLRINIPFVEVLEQRPLSAALKNGLLFEKKALKGDETVVLTKECNALI